MMSMLLLTIGAGGVLGAVAGIIVWFIHGRLFNASDEIEAETEPTEMDHEAKGLPASFEETVQSDISKIKDMIGAMAAVQLSSETTDKMKADLTALRSEMANALDDLGEIGTALNTAAPDEHIKTLVKQSAALNERIDQVVINLDGLQKDIAATGQDQNMMNQIEEQLETVKTRLSSMEQILEVSSNLDQRLEEAIVRLEDANEDRLEKSLAPITAAVAGIVKSQTEIVQRLEHHDMQKQYTEAPSDLVSLGAGDVEFPRQEQEQETFDLTECASRADEESELTRKEQDLPTYSDTAMDKILPESAPFAASGSTTSGPYMQLTEPQVISVMEMPSAVS